MDVRSEANIAECKTCKDKKVRILTSYWGKNKRFVDEHNKLWNGKQCPLCNKDRAKNAMKTLRNGRKNESCSTDPSLS